MRNILKKLFKDEKLNEVEKAFIEKSSRTILNISKNFKNLPLLQVSSLPEEETIVVIIDMNNGFTKKGALASDRAYGLTPYIIEVLEKFKGYKKVFLTDAHDKNSKEFRVFPIHGEKGTPETEIIDELLPFTKENAFIFEKNSINGFLSPQFADFISKHPKIKNMVILGDCTDLCVMSFANTAIQYYNQWNITSNIVIPVKGVETYHLDITNHDGDLMQLFALYNMSTNGVSLVSDIIY